MEVGISTACLYPVVTEDAFEELRACGVTLMELFLNAPSEVEPEFVRRIDAAARASGVKICAVHPYSSGFEPFLFFSNYRRRYEDAMRIYESFYEAANMLGAGLVAMHGDRIGGPLPDEEYFERFGELALHAKSCGCILAQENVARCRSHSPEFISAMRKALGAQVDFVLDLKQAVRAGSTPERMLETMGGRVAHLHLSDSFGMEADCLPPGKGGFDFVAFARRLSRLGYSGVGVVELYRENFGDTAQLVESQRYLQKMLNGV